MFSTHQKKKIAQFGSHLSCHLQNTLKLDWSKISWLGKRLNLSQTVNFRFFQTEDFDLNGRKLSKPVENTVVKAAPACYKQSLLFPQCFPKTCTADM